MTAPLVSVLIPNYNHAGFLESRIESVLNQTYRPLEIILMDDASSDDSKTVINRYSTHPEIAQVILNEKNSGSTFFQWKKGIECASGELIWIAESDDVADQQFLETLVNELINHPEAVLAYCQSYKIDETGKVTGSMLEWTDDLDAERWKIRFQNNGINEIKHYLIGKSTIPNASAVVFRKNCYPVEMDATQFKQSGDTLIYAGILIRGDLIFLPDHLNYHRHHFGTVRSGINPSARLLDSIRFISEIQKLVPFSANEEKLLLSRFRRNSTRITRDPYFGRYFSRLLSASFQVKSKPKLWIFLSLVQSVVIFAFRYLFFRFTLLSKR